MDIVYMVSVKPSGLDMIATCKRIGKMIDESNMNDKQLGTIMNLSVQAINKWRHAHVLPEIENMFILSRVLGRRVDDFLVSQATGQSVVEVEVESGQDYGSKLRFLRTYAALEKRFAFSSVAGCRLLLV